MVFTLGSDTITVPLNTATDVAAPYWATMTVTITASQDYAAGTNFQMQATTGGYIAIDALGGIPCFVAGTTIATCNGGIPIEELRVGDKIMTRDNGLQEIRWIGAKRFNWTALARKPKLKPIVIAKDTFGPGVPQADLRVSPQHRMHMVGEVAQLYFETNEVLAPAKGLCNGRTIKVDRGLCDVVYYHILLDRHEVTLAGGVWTESLHPRGYGP